MIQLEREFPKMCCFLHLVSPGQSCLSYMGYLSNQTAPEIALETAQEQAALPVRNRWTKSITLELKLQSLTINSKAPL